MWFKTLTGFNETTASDVQEKIFAQDTRTQTGLSKAKEFLI